MERFFFEDLGDPGFIPYFQLHEFEALILTDAGCLAKYYPASKDGLEKLAKGVEKFNSSGEVNRMTPPSWPIKAAVSDYQKTLFAISAVMDLGLETIRAACKHFDSWLGKLETLL